MVFDQGSGGQISLIIDQEPASELSSSFEGSTSVKNKPGRAKLGSWAGR